MIFRHALEYNSERSWTDDAVENNLLIYYVIYYVGEYRMHDHEFRSAFKNNSRIIKSDFFIKSIISCLFEVRFVSCLYDLVVNYVHLVSLVLIYD